VVVVVDNRARRREGPCHGWTTPPSRRAAAPGRLDRRGDEIVKTFVPEVFAGAMTFVNEVAGAA
jgi:hypothetical protein